MIMQKFSLDLCYSCPHLDFCRANPHIPLGNDRDHPCPDGVIEKIFPWEIPGEDYYRPGTKYVTPGDSWYEDGGRGLHTSHKVCFIHALVLRERRAVDKSSRYWICRSCTGRYFGPWKKRNKDKIERLRGQPLYVFEKKSS